VYLYLGPTVFSDKTFVLSCDPSSHLFLHVVAPRDRYLGSLSLNGHLQDCRLTKCTETCQHTAITSNTPSLHFPARSFV
jgi:hypothetical protein